MADDDLVTGRGLRIPAGALRWQATRSGGPGGQHANTSDTAVTVTVDLEAAALPAAITARLRERHGDELRATSADSRSQFRNRQTARRRVGELIDEAAVPPTKRRPSRPTRGSQRRRLENKRQQSEKKQRRSWRGDHDG